MLAPLARERHQISTFVTQANTTSVATAQQAVKAAEQSGDLVKIAQAQQKEDQLVAQLLSLSSSSPTPKPS